MGPQPGQPDTPTSPEGPVGRSYRDALVERMKWALGEQKRQEVGGRPPAPRPHGFCPHHRPSRGSSARRPQYILSSLGLSGFCRAPLATESPEHTARWQQGTAPPAAGAQQQAERQTPAQPQGRLEGPLQGARKTARASETVHPYLLARTFEISSLCWLITCG